MTLAVLLVWRLASVPATVAAAQAPSVAATTRATGPAPADQLRDPSHETTTPSVSGVDASSSKCPISSDATYGVSLSNPVRVGGGAAYAGAREIRYFNALRGPDGQGIHYKRSGSLPDRSNSTTILDLYELTYEGLQKPLYVYADAYHWEPPSAPKGLICGAVMELTRPGPDPFERAEQSRALAVELGANPVVPISLDGDGTTGHGVIFDHTRLVAQAARMAAAAGTPLNPKALPSSLAAPRLVVIAYPQACDGRMIAPNSIALLDANGNTPNQTAAATGATIAQLIPGFDTLEGAMAVSYGVASLIPGVRVVIRYVEPACGAAEVSLPIASAPARLLRSIEAIAPPGTPIPQSTTVVLQAFIDFSGRLRAPAYVNGPEALIDAATAAAAEWQVSPATMNGAPILEPQNIGIRFRAP